MQVLFCTLLRGKTSLCVLRIQIISKVLTATLRSSFNAFTDLTYTYRYHQDTYALFLDNSRMTSPLDEFYRSIHGCAKISAIVMREAGLRQIMFEIRSLNSGQI